MDSIWTKTTETIKGKIGEKTYDLWFKSLIL